MTVNILEVGTKLVDEYGVWVVTLVTEYQDDEDESVSIWYDVRHIGSNTEVVLYHEDIGTRMKLA